MESVLDKFLRYISIDTQSDPNSSTQPSSKKQYNLLNQLFNELKELGVKVELDEFGYIMASIDSNIEAKVPKIGFLSHVDTSPDASGKDIKPQIIKNYDGSPIALKGVDKLYLDPQNFPELNSYIGQTLITTDGTTLLGADDKAGIAEIMTAVEYIVKHPEFKHGDIKIGFTPDEEIGRGVIKFNVKKFDADYAYTMDGGKIGELEYENFNAASAKIIIQGRNVHPGYAKNKMINSIIIANEFNSLLPANERPENTSDYEGFYHLNSINGNVEKTELDYIIRDHDKQKFEERKAFMQECVNFINKKYGQDTISAEIYDQYYNMKEKVLPHYHIVETAIKAMELAEITPIIRPIRGGTDGANLSYKGLPCPNIFAGGHNFHGKMEFVPLESMQKATEVILNIISLYSQDK